MIYIVHAHSAIRPIGVVVTTQAVALYSGEDERAAAVAAAAAYVAFSERAMMS